MSNLNDVFFRPTESTQKTYEEILEEVQEYCTSNYASTISSENSMEAGKLLRQFILRYLQKQKYAVEELGTDELADKLYEDMAGYSFLRKWIFMDGIEEVNINSWDDIEVIYQGGRSVKIPEHFISPQQAIDVVRRMLSFCNMIIDDTMPSVLGHLSQHIRISADKTPIVDKDVGVNISIRIVNQQSVSKQKLLDSGSATGEMLDFLVSCIRYGVSVCIAGATGSGKTTIMAWLLSTVPNNYRLITIEDGSREFNLVKRDANGRILNSVVHLLTRPHEKESLNIDQDFLLERVLRKHPNIIGVGEIRASAEAMSVAEASRTGHTCVTTIHSNSSQASYRRMMTLAKRQFDIEDNMLMQIMVEAFPVIVYTKQLDDGSRRIMEIVEGEGYSGGKLNYRTLYRFEVQENRILTDQDSHNAEEVSEIKVIGRHRKISNISDELKSRFLENGIPQKDLERFMKEGEK